jgi:Protein of unknown function (DUF3500)
MIILRRLLPILLLIALLALAGCGGSQEGQQSSQEETSNTAPATTSGESTSAQGGGGDATSRTVAATEAFLATLDDTQREQVSYSFDSEEKSGWSNFPVPVVPRPGLPFSDMTQEQQQAAMAILQAALSEEGYKKTVGIMVGDQVVREQEDNPDLFGLDFYGPAIFGTPSESEPWMLQFNGHHLGLNLTVDGEDNVLTPSFVGVQPAEYTLDEAGDLSAFGPASVLGSGAIRPMGVENDEAFELVNALDSEQQDQAILDYEVSELVLGPGEDGRVLEPEGLPASEMDADQQDMLLDLIRQWVSISNDETAQARMSEIEDGLDDTYFAWSGPTTNGSVIYYRITGPTLHIEFAHQMNDVLHIHSVYRDPTREYGEQPVAG